MRYINKPVLKKTFVCVLIAFVSFLAMLFSVGLSVDAIAADYSTIRVKLSNANDGTLNISLKGNYSINGEKAITGDVVVKIAAAGSLKVYRKSNNALLYSGKSVKFMRSENQSGKTGLIKMYNAYNGWCEYLGDLNITVDAKKFIVINQLPLEHYLYGVVAYEMNNSWPIESLKAQAVAARGYAAGKMSPSKSYDILDTPQDQVYKGFNSSYKNVVAAVDGTKGMILKQNGKIILPYFGASNGGQTELTENIWNNAVAYCKMKDDPYDLKNPLSPRQTVFFPENISANTPLDPKLETFLKTLVAPKLKSQGYSTFSDQIAILGVSALKGTQRKHSAPSNNFTHASATVKLKAMSGGGDGLIIDTSSTEPKKPVFTLISETANGPVYSDEKGNLCDVATVEFIMDEYEYALEEWKNGSSSLNSSGQGFTDAKSELNIDVEFRIYDIKDSKQPYKLLTNSNLIMYYVEQTSGGANIVNARFGHGVGMSQRGAQQMANEGKNYKEILNYYYDNVTIEKLTYNTNAELSGDFEETIAEDLPLDSESEFDLIEEELAEEIIGKTSTKTTIYQSASNSSNKLATINSGKSVSVLGQKGSYILVNASGGINGFVPAKNLYVSSAMGVISKASNMTDSAKKTVAKLKAGENVTILNRSASTYKIQLSDKTEGFVNYSNVRIIVDNPVITLSGSKSYGQVGSATKLYSSKSKAKTIKTLPANSVFEIISKTSNDCYNVIYNGTKGIVEKAKVELIGKGGLHPNPDVLVKEYLGSSSAENLDFSFAVGAPKTIWGGYTLIGENIDAASVSGKITGMTVNMRKEANTGSAIVMQLAENTDIEVIGQSGEFFKVTAANGSTGYVVAEFVAIEKGEKTGIIKNDGVNMRSTANVSSSIVATLTKNTSVKVLGSIGEFYSIETSGGAKGYVSDRFITVQESSIPTLANTGASTTSSGSNSATSSGKAVAAGVVSGDNVRLRKSASSQSGVLTTIPKGSTVEIIATNNSYYKVNYSGHTGYLLATYIPKGTIKQIGLSSAASTQTSSAAATGQSSGYKTGTVKANVLNLRTDSGTLIGRLNKGDSVTILSSSGSKHKVKLNSGSVGFVEGAYISVDSSSGTIQGPTSSKGKTVSATTAINIRASSDGNSRRVGVIYKNENAKLIEESGEWYKIEMNGTTGYAMKKYFK